MYHTLKNFQILNRFILMLVIIPLTIWANIVPKTITITSPEDGETLHNISRLIIQFKPKVNSKMLDLTLWQDNQKVKAKLGYDQLLLDYPVRGEHHLQIKACNKDGQLIAQSQVVTIYIQQNTVGSNKR